MPINDIIEFRLMTYCDVLSQLGENVMHYRVSAITNPEPSLAEKVSQMDGHLVPSLLPLLSTLSRYVMTQGQKVAPLPRGVFTFTRDSAGPGTGATTLLPAQVAGLLSKSTALAGRSQRGRFYVPFPGEADNIDALAVPSAAYATKLDALATTLSNGLNVIDVGDCTLTPVIYHRAARNFTDIQSVQRREGWATQRRRGDQGQRNRVP